EVLRGFVGEQEQEPPVYSAKKLEGRRAYEYAREGEEVRMRKALITIYEAQLDACGLPDEPKVEVRITCSKGTYIRSFARDLGRRLASGAHLVGLRRLRSGGFTVEQCLDLRFLETKLTPSQNSPETNPH
ncbi:MAG: tRNA pseudouridine(55) synthase, partial [Rikenella sp.]|nr:tRNA pseudouridine(55) synthase [Rikenella sp.]